jgi:hypothetical protein
MLPFLRARSPPNEAIGGRPAAHGRRLHGPVAEAPSPRRRWPRRGGGGGRARRRRPSRRRCCGRRRCPHALAVPVVSKTPGSPLIRIDSEAGSRRGRVFVNNAEGAVEWGGGGGRRAPREGGQAASEGKQEQTALSRVPWAALSIHRRRSHPPTIARDPRSHPTKTRLSLRVLLLRRRPPQTPLCRDAPPPQTKRT